MDTELQFDKLTVNVRLLHDSIIWNKLMTDFYCFIKLFTVIAYKTSNVIL